MSGLRRIPADGSSPRTDRARFIELLARLGDPHRRLRCVHVAGTNGKGSTTTFIAFALGAGGYHVGAYFSPYVFDLRERVRVNGEMISRADFARHVSAIRPHIEALAQTPFGPTPEFELKTAVAFRHFAETGVDYAVLEVGIGGRLDATNVIDPPLVAVITQIGWDHMNLLGDTLGKIAFEKAGIFKPGTIGVTAEDKPEALTSIQAVAVEKGVPLHLVRPTGSADNSLVTYRLDAEGRVLLTVGGNALPPLALSLRGAYQAQNAGTAAAALEILRRERGVTISDDALIRGLTQAQLPGRFQILRPDPNGPTLILDGAHNEDGAGTLVTALQAEFGSERRFTFVFGTSRGHAPAPFLSVIAPLTARIYATAPAFRGTPAEDTAQAAIEAGLDVTMVTPAQEAIRQAYRAGGADNVIVVTGSFYVVGETPAEFRE